MSLEGYSRVLGFLLAGYFFGNIPIVQDNFQFVVLAIIGLSFFAVFSIIIGTIRSLRTCPVPSDDERRAIEEIDDLKFKKD